jgi:hypothetical protein
MGSSIIRERRIFENNPYHRFFNSEAFEWNIIRNEFTNLPNRILSGACDCRNTHASKPGICDFK